MDIRFGLGPGERDWTPPQEAVGRLPSVKVETMDAPKKSKRGFASMDPERQREIARKGGKSVPPERRSFSQDTDLAAKAGQKGGRNVEPREAVFFAGHATSPRKPVKRAGVTSIRRSGLFAGPRTGLSRRRKGRRGFA